MLSHTTACFKTLLAALLLGASASSFAQMCTREYAPVCGQVAGSATPQTFSNRCELNNAQASFLYEGTCGATPQEPPRPVGGDMDQHGCRPSAGYQWNAELRSCIRPWMTSVITLEVAPRRMTCMGEIEQQCLMVRERVPGKQPAEWQPLLGDIVGFKHKAGTRYQLRVRKDRMENPPADAPNVTYTLVKRIK
jgi:hypothetical protein